MKEKNELKLAHMNPSVGIDRMDDCLDIYHIIFDAQCISLVSAQCLGRGRFKGGSIWSNKDAYKACAHESFSWHS